MPSAKDPPSWRVFCCAKKKPASRRAFSISCGEASGLIADEPVTLEPRRELGERADARRLGFVAPLLQAVEQRIAVAAIDQCRETRAKLADDAKLRTALGKRIHALGNGGRWLDAASRERMN